MSDYIRKEDAVNVAQNYHCSHDITIVPNTSYSNGFRDGYKLRENDILEGLLELIEPADVAPVVHGEWIPYSIVYENRHRCSKCDYHLVGTPKEEAHFCPNCGAKMDGKA